MEQNIGTVKPDAGGTIRAREQNIGTVKPDAGGTIRAGIQDGGLFLSTQRFEENATVDMDLTPLEARLLGRWLLKLGKEAEK